MGDPNKVIRTGSIQLIAVDFDKLVAENELLKAQLTGALAIIDKLADAGNYHNEAGKKSEIYWWPSEDAEMTPWDYVKHAKAKLLETEHK